MTDQPNFDRFTLPGEIPDGDTPSDAARGYTASHPAGRGWVPGSRDLGIPGEHESTEGSGRAPGTIVHDGVEHSFPYGMPEDPLAAIGSSQVFTLERRVKFLDHLAFKGNVRAAAAKAGVSHETAYRKRRQDTQFAALWDAAVVQARGYAESQLATRALDGIEVPVFHRGEIVAYVTKHDARLLLAHLARLDKQVADNAAAQARSGRFDELLAEYAGHEAPAGFAEAAEEFEVAEGLPPTREEYVAHRRGAAMGGKCERAEARRMAAAAAAAGKAWDAWHASAVAVVEGILAGDGGDDLPYEVKSAPTNRVTSVNPGYPAASSTRSHSGTESWPTTLSGG